MEKYTLKFIYFVSCFFRFDVEGGTSFSPPAHDDSFFVIRYPVGESTKTTSARSLTEALSDVSIANQPPVLLTAANNLTKHTEPCKEYLKNKERKQI